MGPGVSGGKEDLLPQGNTQVQLLPVSFLPFHVPSREPKVPAYTDRLWHESVLCPCCSLCLEHSSQPFFFFFCQVHPY